jgi:hypothetical protein
MIYVRLQNGREVLHSVDSAWNLENVLKITGKAAPWVKEDVPAVQGQLRWLRHIHDTERDMTLLITHDDALFEAVTRSGAIGGELSL